MIQAVYQDSSKWQMISDGLESDSTEYDEISLSEDALSLVELIFSIKGLSIPLENQIELLRSIDSLENVRRSVIRLLNKPTTLPIQFRFPVIPINSSENVLLENIYDLTAELDSSVARINRLDEQTALEASYPESVVLIDSVNATWKGLSPVLKRINTLHKANTLRFFKRSELLTYLFQETSLPKEFDPDSSSLLAQLATDLDLLKSEFSGVENLLESYRREQLKDNELATLEKELLAKRDQVYSILEATTDESFDPYEISSDAIQTLIKYELMTYNEAESRAQRLLLVVDFNSCMENMMTLLKTLIAQPEIVESIEKEYTSTTYNLYTATDITFIEKERIYDSYKEIIIPYISNRITNTISCSNVADLVALIRDTNTRIKELRTSDTIEIERRLRKNSSPEVVLRILGIDARKN